mgnify:FL=1
MAKRCLGGRPRVWFGQMSAAESHKAKLRDHTITQQRVQRAFAMHEPWCELKFQRVFAMIGYNNRVNHGEAKFRDHANTHDDPL